MRRLNDEFSSSIESIVGALSLYERQRDFLLKRREEVFAAGAPYREIRQLLAKGHYSYPLSPQNDSGGFFARKLGNGKTVLDYCDEIRKDERTHKWAFHPNFNRKEPFEYTMSEFHRDIVLLRVSMLGCAVAYLNALTTCLDRWLPPVNSELPQDESGGKTKDCLTRRIESLFGNNKDEQTLILLTKEIVCRRNSHVHNDGKPDAGLTNICKSLTDLDIQTAKRICLPLWYVKNAAATTIEVISKAFFEGKGHSVNAGGILEIAKRVYQVCGCEYFGLLTGFYKWIRKANPEFEWEVNYYVAKKFSSEGLNSEDRKHIANLLNIVSGNDVLWWRAGLHALLDDYNETCDALMKLFLESGIAKNELLYQISTTPVFMHFSKNPQFKDFRERMARED